MSSARDLENGIQVVNWENASPSSLAATMKDVNKAVREITQVIQRYQELMKPRKAALNDEKISSSIYEDGQAVQKNSFNAFPLEVQGAIWRQLTHQPDRIALALTCKSNAQTHNFYEFSYGKIRVRKPTMGHRLAVLIRLLTWVPKDYRLCFCCGRYCLRYGEGEWSGNSKLVDEASIKNGRIPAAFLHRGPRCPKCVFQNNVEFLKDRPKVKTFLSLIKRS